MKSIIVKTPEKGAEIKDINLTGKGIKIKILENGVCGTDREIVNGEMKSAGLPGGFDFMVLGHEAIGRVMEDGNIFKKGDIVMPVNRRGCGKCLNCLMGRADFCETGDFVEAGIKGMHGFMREYIYDDEQYLVKIPEDIMDIAIMAQPLSDLEKSLEEILNVQNRMYWKCPDGTYGCRSALVTGTGPIGILISMLLKSRGFNVTIANIRDASEREARIFDETGIKFFNSSNGYGNINKKFDLVFESSGSNSSLIPQLLGLLRSNGFLGLFGFMRKGIAQISSADWQSFIYRSITITGLINGQKPHYEMAVRDLVEWKHIWQKSTASLITNKVSINENEKVLNTLSSKKPGEIKTKIVWH